MRNMLRLENSGASFERRWLELVVFLLIVAVGVVSRDWLINWPNFKPVAALCLFAGFFFRRYSSAILALVAMMLISDWQLGSYAWQVTVSVYATLAIACGLGWLIKARIAGGHGELNRRRLGGFVASSLLMSSLFFVLTNAAVWQFSGWYPVTADGLVACFTNALPFYRWTLLGDISFTILTLSIYQACWSCVWKSHQGEAIQTEFHC